MGSTADNIERLNCALKRPQIKEGLRVMEISLTGAGAIEVGETVLEFTKQIISLILEKQWGNCCLKAEDPRGIFIKENNKVLMAGGAEKFVEDTAKKIIPKGQEAFTVHLKEMLFSMAIEIGVETRAMVHSIPSEKLRARPPIKQPPSGQHLYQGGPMG